MRTPNIFSVRSRMLVMLLVILACGAVYWSTCFRTITWWNNLEYSLAAITLGIAHPPGSLLLTLLGWPVTRLPLGISGIFALNLLAGLLAAVTSGLVCVLAMTVIGRAWSVDRRSLLARSSTGVALGAGLGGLCVAFGETLWIHATRFTPYVLTALFTVLMLLAMWRWWERADSRGAVRWLFVIGLLLGLDFSVHRTNALLVPGLFFWILLRRPRVLAQIKSWAAGIGGLVIGLALQLLIIPLSARNPFLNMNQPDSWQRFYEYVSLRLYGGGFLLDLLRRNADFWSVQVRDFLEAFVASYAPIDGPLGPAGVLPLLLGIVGLIALWRHSRRLAAATLLVLLVTSLCTVVYFNVPAGFFRSLHRHYLPSLVIYGLLISYGAGSLLLAAWKPGGRSPVSLSLGVTILLLVAVTAQVMRNYRAQDGSQSYFAYDFAVNVFNSLPEKAIVYANGDNDTFPLWYLQAAEGKRPDVTVVNLPLSNLTWYVGQVLSKDRAFPLPFRADNLSEVQFRRWQDTTVAVNVTGHPRDYDLPEGTGLPDSIYVHVPPTLQDQFLMIQDWLLLQTIIENRWRRPIYLLNTVPAPTMDWLLPYLRNEGYVRRLVPVESPPLNRDILRTNLLGKYAYRGCADADIPLDQPSRSMAHVLYRGFIDLANAEWQDGDERACAETRSRLLTLLPPERLEPSEAIREAIDGLCGSSLSEAEQ